MVRESILTSVVALPDFENTSSLGPMLLERDHRASGRGTCVWRWRPGRSAQPRRRLRCQSLGTPPYRPTAPLMGRTVGQQPPSSGITSRAAATSDARHVTRPAKRSTVVTRAMRRRSSYLSGAVRLVEKCRDEADKAGSIRLTERLAAAATVTMEARRPVDHQDAHPIWVPSGSSTMTVRNPSSPA